MQPGISRGQIDQVRIVRHGGRDPSVTKVCPVALDLLERQWPGPPLVAALCEELNRPAADLLTSQRRQIDATGDRHVSAKEQAGSRSPFARSHLHYWPERPDEWLNLMESEPLGKKPSEAGQVDQIEGELLPGKESQCELLCGGHQLRGLLQRYIGLADGTHRQADHEPKLPQPRFLFLEFLSGWHTRPFICHMSLSP
jgi:hypothetical protein